MWVNFTVFAENYKNWNLTHLKNSRLKKGIPIQFPDNEENQYKNQISSQTLLKNNVTFLPIYTKKVFKFVPSSILLHSEKEKNQRGNYPRVKHIFYSDHISQKCRAFLILKLSIWSLLYPILQLVSIQLTTHQYF